MDLAGPESPVGRRARTYLAHGLAYSGRTAHYVKLRLVRSRVVHDLLACVFEVVEHKPDSMGIALTPIMYDVSAEIARAERWDTTAEAFGLLR